MNPLLRAALDMEIATVGRVVDLPTGPLGYGSDIRCVVDVDESMGETDPTSRRAIAEWCLRAIDCPRGQLPDDGDYGVSVLDSLNAPMTDVELRALEGSIRKQFERDDRIAAVEVRATLSLTEIDIDLLITPADSRQAFKLIVAVTDAGLFVKELAE